MRHASTFPHDKATIPVLPSNFVCRKDVRRRLEQLVADAPVTLVCAPAGYGKTLLLADWAEATGAPDKIWISLDAADNDPERFWAVLADAIHTHATTAEIDDTVRLPARPDAVDRLAAVVDAIARLPAPCHLVLDDVHEVVGEETLRGIAGLVAYQPDNLRIVLSCRGTPPLPLARMRLAGRLAVLGPSDLAFSHEDATVLLRAAGTEPTSAQVRLLIEETGGWAAGLRLAARAPHPGHKSTEYDALLARCADRVTEDYLDDEVLSALPAETVDLLRAVSTCDEVTPALAVALSGQDDAAATLAALERETLLVTAVGAGRRWFRPHPLVRSCLRNALVRRYPDRASALHSVAATWFAADDNPAMAFAHAVRSGDPSTSAGLLRVHAVPTLMRGDHRSVRRALDTAGDQAVARDPLLSLVSALTHVQAADPVATRADLARARDAWPAEPSERLPALYRLVTATHGLLHGAPDDAEPVDWHALARAEDGGDLEPWARLGHGWSLLCAGARPAARRELERAERLARERGLDYLVVHSRAALGALSCVDGAVATAEEACSDALAIAGAHGWRGGFAVELARLLTGLARVLRADPAGALAAVSRPETAPIPANLRHLSDVVEGTAHVDIGNRVTGLRLLRRARARLGGLGAPVQIPVGGAQLEHRCALELGRHAHAHEVLAWTTGIAGDCAEVVLMRAWTAFAGDDVAAAEAAVREVLAESRPALWWPVTVVEARLLDAALELRQGRRMRACTALTTALSLAGPASLVRPFRHADPSVLRLLHEHIGGFGGADDFAATVRRTLSTVDAPVNALLTGREQAVLGQLSSRRSLTELAAELTLSVNTVKTHIRSIYTKLGVNSRRAAVVAGRGHGLI